MPPLTYQSLTTSDSPDLVFGSIDYYEPVSDVPARYESINADVTLQSEATYHNPDMPRYVLHQTVHNMWCSDNFDWETEVAFEVERFDAQFGMRYEQGVQSLPSYDESRLIYGR